MLLQLQQPRAALQLMPTGRLLPLQLQHPQWVYDSVSGHFYMLASELAMFASLSTSLLCYAAGTRRNCT